MASERKLLAIVGATASGKSEVALRVAERTGVDILSCDSVQVYREFSIGCAKPTLEEQALVKHHLIDVVAWNEEFDAQRYCALSMDVLAERPAILCGGTGLYLRALRYGLLDAPERDPVLRQRLYDEEAAEPGVLYRRLEQIDPASSQTIEPRNLVHIVRALELHAQTGELPSVLKKRHGFQSERVPMNIIAIDWPRPLLRERINARVRQMLERGLVDEVRGLLAQGVPHDCRPMRAVGYREVCDMLSGQLPEPELEQRIAQSTWEYARRQYTWLRREKDVIWRSVTDGIAPIVAQLIEEYS